VTGYEADLLDGLATFIAAGGIGVTYSPPYTSGQTGTFFSKMPDAPDRCVVLTGYPVTDHPNQALSVIGVQIRTRGTTDPFDVGNLDTAIFQLVQGLTHRTFGTCHVIQMLRKSSVPMGLDSANRWERASNYYADINPPATPYRNQ
jgi:hypothetical protein